jgi:GT2 family glycosyltransferase
VALVLVAHDPGPWFEDCLASIAAQRYEQLATLVVDAGGGDDLERRVAAVLPAAHVVHPPDVEGFGSAANVALTAVTGAAFILLCHDDVRLDPGAVQQLVAEAYRSNAGIVGPKLVDWDHPERLTQVGMGSDKFGAQVPFVEPGEIDQEQHDSVRDVFVVPGAVTLIRADLFSELGGFDDGIVGFGDDLDLCWRAQAVGARVVLAPSARAAHRERTARTTPAATYDAIALRHRIRTVLVAGRAPRRWGVTLQFAVLTLIQIVAALVLGRVRRARSLAGAWTWNVRRHGQIRARRKALRSIRHVSDGDIRRRQQRGSYELVAFVRGRVGANEDRLEAMAGTAKGAAASARTPGARFSVVAWVVVVAVFIVGSRDLLVNGVPAIGGLWAFPSSPGTLADLTLSNYRRVGLGLEGAGPSVLGALALSGYGVAGALGLLRQVLILGLLPLGAIGMWRLARPIGSRRSRVAALLVFVVIPVPYNALGEGRWGALALWAAMPWLVQHLAAASRVAPFGDLGGEPGPGADARPFVHHLLVVGMQTALVALLVPQAPAWLVAVALLLALGGLVAGQIAGAVRMIGVGLGGAIVAIALHFPWALAFNQAQLSLFTGVTSLGGTRLEWGQIVRFDTGPLGGGVFGWMILPAPMLALLIGRSWRLGWAARGWMLALGGWGVAFAATRGVAPGYLPSPEALLAPAATGLALAAGLGVAAFEVDLPGYRFGWRQVVALLSAGAVFVALGPVVVAATDGSWYLPKKSFAQGPLGFLDAEGRTDAFRVLWIGDADLLPAEGWRIDDTRLGTGRKADVLAWATVDSGNPSVEQSWSGPADATTALVDTALRTAADGDTDRLGALLGPMGIRYLIVPSTSSPARGTVGDEARPQALLRLLDAQLDLSTRDVDAGLAVYENTAWGPTRALLPDGTVLPGGGDQLRDRTSPEVVGAPTALALTSAPDAASGSIDQPASVYLAAPSSDRWQLRSGGTAAARADAFGWANQWSVSTPGPATLSYDTPISRPFMVLGQLVLWMAAIAVILGTRVRRERQQAAAESDGASP